MPVIDTLSLIGLGVFVCLFLQTFAPRRTLPAEPWTLKQVLLVVALAGIACAFIAEMYGVYHH